MAVDDSGDWAGHPLLDTVASLWPTARVSIAPGRRGPSRKELIYVPNADEPRLLVPGGHRRAAASALLRFNHYLPIRDRVSRLVAAVGLRGGAERLLAHRIALVEDATSPDSIETYLSDLLGEEVVVSLGIGQARANQKPVLEAFNAAGRCLAFVKIGDTSLTRDLVRAEAEALHRVGSRWWSTISVPALISLGTWHSFEVLVMSALPVRARPAVRRPVASPPRKSMRELAKAFLEGNQPVATCVLMQRLRAVAEEIPEPQTASAYATALDRIAQRHAHTVLDFAAWHGDWTPWNMAWKGRRVQLWDWERFETGVPIGMDRIHYVLSALARRHGFTAPTIEHALELRTAREYARPAQQQALGELYVATIADRYLAGSRSGHGGTVQVQAAAALAALTDLSRRPVGTP